MASGCCRSVGPEPFRWIYQFHLNGLTWFTCTRRDDFAKLMRYSFSKSAPYLVYFCFHGPQDTTATDFKNIIRFPEMKKDTAIILIFSLIAYSLLVGTTHFAQSYVIFKSRGDSTNPPKHLDVTEVVLITPDGERLNAWWQHTRNATKTILYFQGNGTNISYKTYRMNTFHEMGVNALMIDYRGYGRSTGRIKKEQDIYPFNAIVINTSVCTTTPGEHRYRFRFRPRMTFGLNGTLF